MKLYVARHTETNYNMLKLCNADPGVDVHLTELGIAQARQLADKLKAVPIDCIYISELPRTRQTARYLAQYDKLPVKVDKRLNDNDTGFEGRPAWEFLEVFNNSADKWHEKFNDGESLAEVRDRVGAFLADIQSRPVAAALIITHGFIIECIHGIVHDLPFDLAQGFVVPQGEFVIFEV
jgi:alpha-ribazole phosphatase